MLLLKLLLLCYSRHSNFWYESIYWYICCTSVYQKQWYWLCVGSWSWGYGWYFLITTYQYFFAMPPPFHTSPINDISTFMSHTRHIHKIVNLWWWRRWKPSCVRHKLDLQGTTIFPTEEILKVFPYTTFDRHPCDPQDRS